MRGGYKAAEDGFGGDLAMDEAVPNSAGWEEDGQLPKEMPLCWGEVLMAGESEASKCL